MQIVWSLPRVQALLALFHDEEEPRLGRTQVHGPRAWATNTSELMLQEEFEQRGITMETLQHVFPLHQAHPPPAPPTPA